MITYHNTSREGATAETYAIHFFRAHAFVQTLPRIAYCDLSSRDKKCFVCNTQYGASRPNGKAELAVQTPCCKQIIGLSCMEIWLYDKYENYCYYCMYSFYPDFGYITGKIHADYEAILSMNVALSRIFDLLRTNSKQREEARRTRLSREQWWYCWSQNGYVADIPPLAPAFEDEYDQLRVKQVRALFIELAQRGDFNIVWFRDNSDVTRLWVKDQQLIFNRLRAEGFVYEHSVFGDGGYGWSLGDQGPYLRVSRDPDDHKAVNF